MINLETLDYNNNTNEVEAGFGGFLEDGFTLTCEVEFDEVLEEEADYSIGRTSDVYSYNNFTFWYIEIKDAAGDVVKFLNPMMKEIKQELENEIINQLEN